MSVDFGVMIMAGGRGSRLGGGMEKPLATVGGVEMLERVVRAVRSSRHPGPIVVVCSPHTPNTAREAARMGLVVLTTEGLGYVEDMRRALAASGFRCALVVNSDLPFLTPGLIDWAVDEYYRAGKPSLAVVVRIDDMRALGFEPDHQRDGLAPAGVNVVDAKLSTSEDEVGQRLLIAEDSSSLVNVNSRGDLQRAEMMSKAGAAQS